MLGCETLSKNMKTPNVKKNNLKCEDIVAIKIFQVLDDSALGMVCEYDDCIRLGHVVYVPKDAEKIYYDDQIIRIKDNECIIYTNTYRYITRETNYKTVPIITIINLQEIR